MKYSKLLEILYGKDIEKIINVLNQSIYVTDFTPNDSESLVLHTGFSFESHKNKRIDILYDLMTESIIRQVHNDRLSIPLICGIYAVKQNSQYFNSFYEFIVTDVFENNNEKAGIQLLKNPATYFNKNSIIEIIVIDKETKEENHISSINIHYNDSQIKETPLQKKLADKIYFGQNSFSHYIDNNEYCDDSEDYSNNYQSNEDWMREEFGDDAETAYWNID